MIKNADDSEVVKKEEKIEGLIKTKSEETFDETQNTKKLMDSNDYVDIDYAKNIIESNYHIKVADIKDFDSKERLFDYIGDIDAKLILMAENIDSCHNKKTVSLDCFKNKLSACFENKSRIHKEKCKGINDDENIVVDIKQYLSKNKMNIRKATKGLVVVAACIALVFGLKFAITTTPKYDNTNSDNDIDKNRDNNDDINTIDEDAKKYNEFEEDIDNNIDNDNDEIKIIDNDIRNDDNDTYIVENDNSNFSKEYSKIVPKGVFNEVFMNNGTVGYFDLDMDGTQEKIVLNYPSDEYKCYVTVNNSNKKGIDFDDRTDKINVFTYSFDGNDMYLVIKLSADYNHESHFFYKYSDNALIKCGTIKGEMNIQSDGSIRGIVDNKLDNIGYSNNLDVYFKPNESGMIVPYTTSVMSFDSKYPVYTYDENNDLMISKKILVSKNIGEKPSITINPGVVYNKMITSTEYDVAYVSNRVENGLIYEADSYLEKDSIWIYIEALDGTKGWLNITKKMINDYRMGNSDNIFKK